VHIQIQSDQRESLNILWAIDNYLPTFSFSKQIQCKQLYQNTDTTSCSGKGQHVIDYTRLIAIRRLVDLQVLLITSWFISLYCFRGRGFHIASVRAPSK